MSETYQLLTQMKVKNLKMFETSRGVAWSAELHSPQLGGHIVNVENNGQGGCNMYRVVPNKLSPQVWFEQVYHPLELEAKALTGKQWEAFDRILDYTNDNETLGVGLARYLKAHP